MKPVTIRPAQRNDAALLAQLINMAGEGIPLRLWSELAGAGADPWSLGRARAARDVGGFSWRHAWLAEIEGKDAGMLLAYRLELHDADPHIPAVLKPALELEAQLVGSWYVNALACLPRHRGRGVGTRLLQYSAELAREAGAHEQALLVFSRNAGARALYQRLGFRERDWRPAVRRPGWPMRGDWLLLAQQLA